MASRIDPYSLELFRLVARARSFARAAGHAHLDPTALGRRIRRLEENLGAELFVRSTGGLSLTEAGHRLLERANEIQRVLDGLLAEIGNPSGTVRGSIRVAANPSSMLALLPQTLATMRERYPDVAVQLVETSTPEVVRECATGGADIGVGSDYQRVVGIHRRRLLEDLLVLVVLPGHPLAADGPVRFSETLEWPHVMTRGGVLDDVLYRQARALRHEVRAAVVVRSYDVTCRMVEAGVGIAIMPALALRGFPGDARFAVRPLDESWARRALWAYTHWRTPPDRATAAFVDVLKSHSRSRPA